MARLHIQYDASSPNGRRRRGRVAYAISTFAVAGALAGTLLFMPAAASAGKPPSGGGTPTPTVPKVLRVGDIDGVAATGKSGWSAQVTATAHDANDQPVEGVTVAGRWTSGAAGTVACVTGRRGTCTMSSPKVGAAMPSIGFRVDGLALSGSTYEGALNHDPDGSSDGTSTIVSK